jgi:hypothetical protein
MWHIPMRHSLAHASQKLNAQGMLTITGDGDDFCLFEVSKRLVFDVSAQAEVFLKTFVWDCEHLMSTNGTSPVQLDREG